MKIIIAPAKKMNENTDFCRAKTSPVYLKEAEELLSFLRSLSFKELRGLWKCNEKIASLNAERLKGMSIKDALTPAIYAYEGIQYRYMAPEVLSDEGLQYLDAHLRIISGFYGILRPFDGVRPYRLEMCAAAKVGGTKDLYEFWGDRIYRELEDDDSLIINLASKEYADAVKAHITSKDRFLTCVFGELKDSRIIQKGVHVKMARGEMVRFMAENAIEDPEDLKAFDGISYHYDEKRSSKDNYIFLK